MRLLLCLAVTFTSLLPAIADEWTVGKTVPKDERIAVEQIDHAVWSDLLNRYVDSEGFVDYRRWKAAPRDQARLEEYLETLSSASLTSGSSRAARLAFWINAYNAVTVRGILREYPTDSIRNHTARLFGYNIWHDLLLQVGDKRYSLDQIEHQILRKMDEPRIHFAIVCASISCPRLRDEAYLPEKIEAQLADNTRHFFRQTKHFRFADDGTIHLSAILDWFGEDFGETQNKRLARIMPWLPEATARAIRESKKSLRIEYIDYDWRLNEQP